MKNLKMKIKVSNNFDPPKQGFEPWLLNNKWNNLISKFGLISERMNQSDRVQPVQEKDVKKI